MKLWGLLGFCPTLFPKRSLVGRNRASVNLGTIVENCPVYTFEQKALATLKDTRRGWGRGGRRGRGQGRGTDAGEGTSQASNERGRAEARRGRSSWRPYNSRPQTVRPQPISFQLPALEVTASEKISIAVHEDNGPFPTWRKYFPREAYDRLSPTAKKINAATSHLKSYPTTYDLAKAKEDRWFPIKLSILERDVKFTESWQTFNDDLANSPEQTLACLSFAMQTLLPEESLNCDVIRGRLMGFKPVSRFAALGISSYSKMISVQGMVIRMATPELICRWQAFRCATCKTHQAVYQANGIVTMPQSCPKVGCRVRSNFVADHLSPFTQNVFQQMLRFQESETNSGGDMVPRTIEVMLTNDLVDSVHPGDDVTITGILMARQQGGAAFSIYVSATSIVSNSGTQMRGARPTIDCGSTDMEVINEIQKESSPFRLLVHSIAPAIFGHEMVKAALVLALLGGTNSKFGGLQRSDIHVLMVGDPGVGKSKLLRACTTVAPRSMYVCTNNSSVVGLTACMRYEKGLGVSVDPGALVLANEGVCCMDEIDMLKENHQALLEVMEQQSVSITKAGIITKLPAKTTILAATNPIHGHYDKRRTLMENLKMKDALLTRFDLIFIMLDEPNEEIDNLLTAHIQSMHEQTSSGSGRSSRQSGASSVKTEIHPDAPLMEKLQLAPNEEIDSLPSSLMQMYIRYARKHCQPNLDLEAKNVIKNYYMELRRARSSCSFPVTMRLLHALIRLTQARARADLREVATVYDANDIITIMRKSIFEINGGETTLLPFESLPKGNRKGIGSQVKRFALILQSCGIHNRKSEFSRDELRQLAVRGNITENLNTLIDALNLQGCLLKKGSDLYKYIAD